MRGRGRCELAYLRDRICVLLRGDQPGVHCSSEARRPSISRQAEVWRLSLDIRPKTCNSQQVREAGEGRGARRKVIPETFDRGGGVRLLLEDDLSLSCDAAAVRGSAVGAAGKAQRLRQLAAQLAVGGPDVELAQVLCGPDVGPPQPLDAPDLRCARARAVEPGDEPALARLEPAEDSCDVRPGIALRGRAADRPRRSPRTGSAGRSRRAGSRPRRSRPSTTEAGRPATVRPS